MTLAEIRALDFIRARIVATQTAPTLSELCAGMGWASRSTAHRVVTSLVRQGALTRKPGSLRGLALADAPLLTVVPTADLRAELARRGQGAVQ
ncbi:MAG TPA: helix-turn-helix domain-containing protein [Sphingopyxis sp.]|jgi:SOS-response transcriptional repressor LexA|uniref:LexA family protein n=1 Tax=Sphingopyxis sp. TaxID=1908224 RepID=UPI002E0D31EF|nr:helix-turn-helix domain-containing protein [Sphingopyxis sp.]